MKQLVRSILKPAAAAYDRLRPPTGGVTVLAYHRVGAGTSSQVDLDAGLFDEQMAELAESGRLISLDDAVDLLTRPDTHKTAPDDADTAGPVVITFDDGTADFIDNAVPILQRHRAPATLYLATGHVEDGVGFWDPTDAPLTWSALREATSTGLIDIGSHTHHHRLLDRLSATEVVDELERSIDLIETHLGETPAHFAYPKALAPNAVADQAVRARFDSAAVAGTHANPYHGTDVHLLARSPIQQSDAMKWFRHKASGGLGLEDNIRDRINARRYAKASS